jgi:hypothetical protein
MRVRWRAAIIEIVDVWIEGWRHRQEAWYFTDLGLGRGSAGEVRLFGLRDWLRQRLHAAGIEAWTPTWEQRKVSMGRNTTLHLVLTGWARGPGTRLGRRPEVSNRRSSI